MKEQILVSQRPGNLPPVVSLPGNPKTGLTVYLDTQLYFHTWLSKSKLMF